MAVHRAQILSGVVHTLIEIAMRMEIMAFLSQLLVAYEKSDSLMKTTLIIRYNLKSSLSAVHH